MKYYDSLDMIPIYNFFKAEKDISYLLYEKRDITNSERDQLTSSLEILMQEYNNRITSGLSIVIEERKSIARLINQYHIIYNCLHALQYKRFDKLTFDFSEFEKILYDYGYGLQYSNEKEFNNELIRQVGRLKGLENRIIKKKNKLKIDNEKEFNLFTTLAVMESLLKIKIDPFIDTMSKYIAYEHQTRLIQKKNASNTR